MNNIPKIIHYVWFGGAEKSELINKYLSTWHDKLSGYEFVEWNESTFDVNINNFCKQAYQNKKWAFVSDYARCWILYNYGGIYLDTDVEVLKSFDDFLDNQAFTCYEKEPLFLEAAVMGSVKEFPFFLKVMNYYDSQNFVNADGSLNMRPIPSILRDICLESGAEVTKKEQVVDGLHIYPQEYFSPYNPNNHKFEITEKTHAVHRYTLSWLGKEYKLSREYIHKYGHKKGVILFVLRHPILTVKIKINNKKNKKFLNANAEKNLGEK